LHARIQREGGAKEAAQTKIDAVIKAAISKARPLKPHEAHEELIRKAILTDPAVAALFDDEETKKLLLRQGLLKVVDDHVRRHVRAHPHQGPLLPF